MKQNDCLVTVLWQYEEGDDDIKEFGEGFTDLLNLDFQYIPIHLV